MRDAFPVVIPRTGSLVTIERPPTLNEPVVMQPTANGGAAKPPSQVAALTPTRFAARTIAGSAPIAEAPPQGSTLVPPDRSVPQAGPLVPATTTPTALAVPPLDPTAEPTVAVAPLTATTPSAVLPTATAAPATLQSFGFTSDDLSLSYDDELILEIGIAGSPGTDTIIAYGSGDGIYLPFGAVARFLDLPFTVSDDGNFASGWFLSEDRTLSIDLRQSEITLNGTITPLAPRDAIAFDGELYVLAGKFADLLPLSLTPDLRNQSVTIATRETFPFEARLAREAARQRLGTRTITTPARFPREETPYLPLSVPITDVELRALSDDARGSQIEGDLRLAGDFAWMTAEVFVSASTRDGLIGAFVELGREDGDADLLGPLQATQFALGDIGTTSMPLGLRGVSGRGATITNAPIEVASVFEEIDLRGFLPDGFEVELYRNGVLIDSIRTPVNGQYEFFQVPVDYGLNVFKLIFFGPQGQRREETRQISVGDGRLAPGKLVYSLDAVQREVNLLNVRRPEFRPGRDFGRWRAGAQIDYGLTSGITTNLSAAWFDTDDFGERWLATGGLRAGFGALAVKADLGFSDGAGRALELGVGGRALGGSFIASHTEYRGGFLDETRSPNGALLTRASELDLNFNLALGGQIARIVPISGRLRHLRFQDDRQQTSATVRASTRLRGALISNSFDLARTVQSGGDTDTQIRGNFDLTTLTRSRTQIRASVGYAVYPQAELTTGSVEVDYRLDDRTRFTGGIGYGFRDRSTLIGLSASRRFDRFDLSLNGQYGVRDDSYAATLRLGFSFGRDPIGGGVYFARPGRSSSGAVAIRAFEDGNGNRIYDAGDTLLPDVAFTAANDTGLTDADGTVRLDNLGRGNRASVQVDPGSFPDINLIPATRGIEIVPRPGRIHVTDFAVLTTSEIEGTAFFDNGETQRGVSGVRLQLLDDTGEAVKLRRTESDGYYFFEQVPPGNYTVIIDPKQAAQLKLCLAEPIAVEVAPGDDLVSSNFTIRQCDAP